MRKLSPSMQLALDNLPLHFSRFGSSLMGHNFPSGVTMATINALCDRGLVRIVKSGAFGRAVVKKDQAHASE